MIAMGWMRDPMEEECGSGRRAEEGTRIAMAQESVERSGSRVGEATIRRRNDGNTSSSAFRKPRSRVAHSPRMDKEAPTDV